MRKNGTKQYMREELVRTFQEQGLDIDEIFRVRTSGLKSFLQCPRQYYYSYVEDVPEDAEEPQIYLPWFLGSIGHYLLERKLTGSLDYPQALQVYIEEELDTATEKSLALEKGVDVIKMLRHHDQYWAYSAYHPASDFEVLTIETKFLEQFRDSLTQDPPYLYTGIIDGLVRIDGELWLLEHKFVANPLRYMEGIEFDYQPYVYYHMISKTVPIKGILYNLIGKVVPEPPKRNKRRGAYGDYSVRGLKGTFPYFQQWALEEGITFDPRFLTYITSTEFEQKHFIRYKFVPQQDNYSRVLDSVGAHTTRLSQLQKPTTGAVIDSYPPIYDSYRNCGRCKYKFKCMN